MMPTQAPATVQDQLQRAIIRLYEVFEPSALAPHLEGCPCCAGKREEQPLRARPLSELSAEDLAQFAWSALTTWGGVDGLKHFLPRLLELAANDESPCDVEILFGKLALGEWRTWPLPEQLAVEAYLDALWGAVLSAPPTRGRASLEDWLCAFACASTPDEFGVYLEYWQGHLEGPAAEHLFRLAQERFEHRVMGRGLNAFWTNAADQEQTLFRWLVSPGLQKALERAFFQLAEGPEAQAISDALSILEIYARLPNRSA